MRLLADSSGLADANTLQMIWGRLVSASAGITDLTGREVTVARLLADVLGIADAQTLAATVMRIAIDSAGMADTTLRDATLYRTIADLLAIADILTAGGAGVEHLLLVIERLAMTDSGRPQPHQPYRVVRKRVFMPGMVAAKVKGFQ